MGITDKATFLRIGSIIWNSATPITAPLGQTLKDERWFGRGYNTDDFQSVLLDKQLQNIRATDLKKIKIHPNAKHKQSIRKTMFANLPWYYHGAIGIKPNDYDLASAIDGAKHRVGGQTPPINRKTLRQFSSFCKSWFKQHLQPLVWHTDTSVETWLRESPYTMDRRKELMDEYNRNVYELNVVKKPNFTKLESFIKDEFYMEPKTFRTINSRIEFYKCLVGPIIHAVEKEVFKLPYFIKKVPVAERAQYIIDNIYTPGNINSGSDASNWEGSMKAEIMSACEIQMFKHMTQNLPQHGSFMNVYRQLLLTNQLCFSGFYCEVLSRRMSGEMSTSVGNGITNLMLVLFTAFKQRIVIKIVVEGDDALVSSPIMIIDKYFKRLGFNYVLTQFESINESSFCGLIFADIKHTIRDPIKAILKLGWCTQQYVFSSYKTRIQLLRAKALSMKCEMGNCPLLGPLADRLIHLTSHISIRASIRTMVRSLGLYHRNEFLDIISSSNYSPAWQLPSEVSAESRILMSKLYGIDVNSQLHIEHYFSKMSLGSFQNDNFDVFIPRDNRQYWAMYMRNTGAPLVIDTQITTRVSYYQTYLPLNHVSDSRLVFPTYAQGVGT